MGFKANFCCFCCCGMKPKKFTRSVCILFIVLSAIGILLNIISISRAVGVAMVSPIISLVLGLIMFFFSIFVLIKIKKGNWGIVKCYGITCLIINIIAVVMAIVGLALYLFAVGVIGSAVAAHDENGNATTTVVGFLLIIGILPYAVFFLIYSWFIHLSYKVIKGSDYMEDKEEEKAEEKAQKKQDEMAYQQNQYNQYPSGQNQNYNPQGGYPQGQPQGHPQYPPQNQGFPQTENKDLNKVENDYKA